MGEEIESDRIKWNSFSDFITGFYVLNFCCFKLTDD
jgi:hypothetical protein